MEEISLDSLRLNPQAQAVIESAKRKKRKSRSRRTGEWFVWGPIPESYITRAAKLPGKSLIVWLALWTEHHCRKGKPLRVTTGLLERFHVHRNAAYRALKHLEGARLLVADRRPGRIANVRLLLDPPNSPPEESNT